jgi:hypothetical protein
MATITCEQVIAKFEELHAKYYNTDSKVYMVTTIPDSMAASFIQSNPNSIWQQRYKYAVSENVPILCATVEIELLGRNFEIKFDRPYKQDHHSEFEYHFGFGGHCKGYTDNRIIACFPRTHIGHTVDATDDEINVADMLTVTSDEAIDEEYVKRALALLVLGGYVKYWDAYYEFSAWFSSFGIFPGADVKAADVILHYIFDHMGAIKEVEAATVGDFVLD